jgi:1-deoxy-D-xylulose-5-phosphate reductoisomerase
MGRKISVDSATMMNKALEVIEARWLFDLEPHRIRAVIHPQSIVHSMVVCKDQSVLAQLGTPDMRVPIAYGLAWPNRIESGAQGLNWTSLKALTFEEADERRFPGLFLAWAALDGPLGSTAVLNAANEVAVERFLSGRIGFMDIHRLNARALSQVDPQLDVRAGVEDLIALDRRVRAYVGEWADAQAR